MGQMNIYEHRKLGEALRQWDELGWDDTVVFAAARLTYDRWQECGECEGSRVRHNDGWIRHPEQNPCPSCGGTGLRPNQARLEAGLAEIPIHYDDEWAQDIYSHEERMEFFAAAVRAFDKETNK